MEEVKKPTSIVAKELEQKITKVINEAELPMFIVKPIVDRILRQVNILEEQELKKETEEYNKKLEESKEKKGK